MTQSPHPAPNRDADPNLLNELRRMRLAPEYERPFDATEPLVSVCIPTFNRHRELLELSIPSVTAQDYPTVEIIVIGDCSPKETERVLQEYKHPRFTFQNLEVRGPYPRDPEHFWMVAGTYAANRAMELASGDWILLHNDDDALRPSCISELLKEAKTSHSEVAYGCLERHAPDGENTVIGVYPPTFGEFGWQAALQHRMLRKLPFSASAWRINETGDWNRLQTLLRLGISFAFTDSVLCDYYPSRLWAEPSSASDSFVSDS